LPHGFKNIKLGDNSIVANSHIATLNITDDNWLAWSINNSTQTLSIEHTAPLTTNTSTVGLNAATTFNFGETIHIPKVTYDQRGHISSTTTVGATLPKLTLSSTATTSSILTGVNTNGTALTQKNLTEIVLGGYSSTSTLIKATDTLGNALKTMAEKISSLESKISTLEGKVSTLESKVK
jgi:hypothetical protein